ncbi:MAG: TSUP family transporter [Clostridia bacterium]|nr:TSUP family transporter [Clostridia bacterium]
MQKNKNIFLSVILGLIIGFINGFFGGGGGMVVVPLLTKHYKLEQKEAQATAIAVMLPICIASAIIYLFSVKLSLYNLLSCAGGVTLGGTVGAFLLKGASNKTVAYIFAFVMLVAGAKLAFF